jgi:capsular exopolysaccharide synthesis family protein
MTSLTRYDMNVPAPSEWPPAYERSEQSSMRYWLGVIASRGWRAGLVGLLVAGAVVGAISQITPHYYAEGSVLVQPSRENFAQESRNQNGQQIDTSAVDTEVEMLKSRALSETVIEKLDLLHDPEFNPPPAAQWHMNVESHFPFVDIAQHPVEVTPQAMLTKTVDIVQKRTIAKRIGLTDVIHVGFTSTDPVKGERIVNALIDAYLARQVTEKVNLVAQANEELGASVDKLRESALTSAATTEEYKNSHSILSTDGASMLEGEISKLDQQIAQAHADLVQKQGQLSAAVGTKGADGGEIPAALSSQTVMELRKQEAQISTQVANLSAQFKPDYPETKRAQAQLDDIRGQIKRELNRIHSGVTADIHAAADREQSLIASRNQAQGTLTTNNNARVALVALELKADAAKKTYEGYLNRASDVAAARTLQQADASVNYRAAAATDSPSPNMRIAAALAALLGLLSATLAIIVPELWNRRMRNSNDVELNIGLPLAATLPDLRSIPHIRRLRGPDAVVNSLAADRFTAFAEAFRNLRAFLALSDHADTAKIIAITSSLPREGKSVTSLCLAQTLAQTGASVVVVDCDVRRRGLTALVPEATNARIGLIEVVKQEATLDEALILDPRSGAWVLPVVAFHGIPEDLFSTREADVLFRALAQRFDHVVLDTPPLLGVADARIVASKADKVLFVVRWNKTAVSAVQAASDMLQQCGANVAGAVLSQVNVRQQSRFGYGDSSDYFGSYKHYYLGSKS